MDIVLQGLLEYEGEMRTFGAVAVVVIALIVNLCHGDIEHSLRSLYLRGDLRQIRYLQRCAVLSDDIHHRDIVKIKCSVFYTEFVLWKLEGLLNQIDVLVLHDA